MPERDLQDRIRSMCAALGLEVQHIEDSRRSWLPGWPDLVIFGTATLWRELKSAAGTLTPEQRACGSRITRSGGDWAVWRPVDLYSGHIETRLQEIA